MGIELPPGYQPSEDEEFMNPKQVAYFRRRLEELRAQICTESLLRVSHRKPVTAAGRETKPTMPARI